MTQNPAMEGRLVNGKNFLVGVHSRQVVHVGADIRQDYLPKVCFDMFDVPKVCFDMFDMPNICSDMFDVTKVCFDTFDLSKYTFDMSNLSKHTNFRHVGASLLQPK